jgi:arylsulfatase A-like enzyme
VIRPLSVSRVARLLAAALLLCTIVSFGRSWRSWQSSAERAGEDERERFPPPPASIDAAAVDNATKAERWTQYADYGTVRIGGVERPAALLTGRTRFVRRATVRAGARYEVFVGAAQAPVDVEVRCAGASSIAARAEPGEWRRVSLDLPAAAGTQSIDVVVDVPPGAVAAWGSETLAALRRPPSRPDVLLISLDTVRRDQLSPYAPLQTTPALADFARDAAVFDDAISTSSWTIASHATLFTGRYLPDSLGYGSRVEPEEQTLAEIFAGHGYRTFGVSGGPYTDPRWGLHQGFDEYVISGERENAKKASELAVDWLERGGETASFAFLNLFDAHEPLELSPAVERAAGESADVSAAAWFDLDSGRHPITPDVRQRLLTAYRAELTSMDRQLHSVFEFLRRTGRWERTLIIIWSDHGQLLGERGFVGHAYTLDEELLRVPLMVKPAAGNRLTRRRYDELIQGDDLFALTQTLAGISSREGTEMLDALRLRRRIRGLAFSKIHHDPFPELMAQRRWRSATQWAVQDGRTKIVRDLEGRLSVFDLSGTEEQPVSAAGVPATLQAALDRFHDWTSAARSARTLGPLFAAERERLRSLGYIQ